MYNESKQTKLMEKTSSLLSFETSDVLLSSKCPSPPSMQENENVSHEASQTSDFSPSSPSSTVSQKISSFDKDYSDDNNHQCSTLSSAPRSSQSSARRVKRDPMKESRSVSIGEDEEGSMLLNQYQVKQDIGKGSYGLVKLAYNADDSNFYAMKILSKSRLRKAFGFLRRPPLRVSARSSSVNNPTNKEASEGSLSLSPAATPFKEPLNRVYQEITIQKKLDHPNIVKLVEVLDDPQHDNLYMVFEYVEKGPVMIVGRDEPLPENQAWKYMRDIVLGLEYLHFQKIIHRDIKPENLLLTVDDHIKITDFGVSNEFDGDDIELKNTAGSPAFMAPESVAEGGNFFTGKALDVWALGVTLYCFLFGQVPFKGENRFALYNAIAEQPVVLPTLPEISADAMDLLKNMLQKDPLKRITIPEIKVHPWITEQGKEPLPSETENCSDGIIEINEEDIRQCVRTIPKLETLIFVKMMLRQRIFRNPIHNNSANINRQ